ncbi:hypothetical protein KJ972_01640, partial [Candidatus Micrarchaeota archaeon]|nr:hypothetical protein [Candidatus Micrarchaeota archaeon]
MYLIDSASKERLIAQNACLDGVWKGFENARVVALEAPTGFGKTFVALGLAKRSIQQNKQEVLVATAATNHTINFWKDHLKQEGFSDSSVNLCFLVGKANQTFKPCFFLDDWVKKGSKEAREADSIYSLCSLKKEHNDCVHFENVFGEQSDGSKGLTAQGLLAANQLHQKLSGPLRDYREQDLINVIGGLKEQALCPYYLFKHNFLRASIKVCDYQYLINPTYLEADTRNFLLVIDEFDKFEDRLREQFQIELSQKQLHNILLDLSPQNRTLFRHVFEKIVPEKKKEVVRAISDYVLMLQDFFDGISTDLTSKEPKGIDLEKEFLGVQFYKEGHDRFNKFFAENKETFIKIISNTALKKSPYRHLLAFHYRLESSLKQKDSISFVEFVQKKQKEDYSDTVLVRRPLVFTEFYQALARRYDKILVMSATLPFKEMLEINFGQKVNWVRAPKIAGFTGKKQGIIFKSPFLDYSSKKRGQNISEKTGVLVELLDELSRVRKEIVVFFNAYSALNACKELLFKELNERGFELFVDQEKKEVALHNRDHYWEQFKRFKGKKVMFSTMYTKYARGSNILKDSGCRIQVLVGIPYPRVYPFELDKFNELVKKHDWKMDAATWYYVLNTRQAFTQVIGRLTRHKKDFGFFVILSNKSVDRILDQKHRDALDIRTET